MGNVLKIILLKENLIFIEIWGCYAMEAENPRPGSGSVMVRPTDLKIPQNYILTKVKKWY